MKKYITLSLLAVCLLFGLGYLHAKAAIVEGFTEVQQGDQRFSTTTLAVGQIKTGIGFLHALTLEGTSTYTTIGLYDGVGETNLIGTTTIGTQGATTLTFDSTFINGLYIVETGTAIPLVVSYH